MRGFLVWDYKFIFNVYFPTQLYFSSGDSRRTLSGLEISSEMLRPLYRKYHCARLNCCIAIISCTNVNVNAYDKFIFSENKKKNQFIWSEIIDVSQPIHLGLVLDKEFFKRKHLVTVRQSDSSPSALGMGYHILIYLSALIHFLPNGRCIYFLDTTPIFRLCKNNIFRKMLEISGPITKKYGI